MRIDELKPSEIKAWKGQNTPDKIDKAMRNKGFELVGTGYYSRVYEKPGSNVAVKVTKAPDKCWLKFAELARSVKNPHFPKIGKPQMLHDKLPYYVVFMERLDGLDKLRNIEKNIFLDALNDAHAAMHDGDWDDLMHNRPGPDYEDFAALLKVRDEMPSFVQALNILYQNKPGGCYPDLHRGNVLTRNGVPVLIDVYAD